MNKLSDFNASLLNGTLYLTGKITPSLMVNILCDNVTVFDSDIAITEKEITSIIKVPRENHHEGDIITQEDRYFIHYEGKIISQGDKYVTFESMDGSIFTTEYTNIMTSRFPSFSLSTNTKKPKVRLEFNNKLMYEIHSNLNDDELNQTVILTSRLPYTLENITNFRLSFQGHETENYNATNYLAEMSLKKSAVISDDIGLPIDLGTIDTLIPYTKTRVILPPAEIEILEKKFTYILGDLYCDLEKKIKVKKGNIYPGRVTINDDEELPISFIDMSLQKTGNEFMVNFGKYPGINITLIYTEDDVRLTITSNEKKYPFNLFVKGSELDMNYELHIKSKQVTQKLKLRKKEKLEE